MRTGIYASAKGAILGQTLSLLDANVYVLPVNSNYSPDYTTHVTLTDVPGSARVVGGVPLNGKSLVQAGTGYKFDADDAVFTSIANPSTVSGILLYLKGSDDAHSKLIGYFDYFPGMPFVVVTGTVTFHWPAYAIFVLDDGVLGGPQGTTGTVGNIPDPVNGILAKLSDTSVRTAEHASVSHDGYTEHSADRDGGAATYGDDRFGAFSSVVVRDLAIDGSPRDVQVWSHNIYVQDTQPIGSWFNFGGFGVGGGADFVDHHATYQWLLDVGNYKAGIAVYADGAYDFAPTTSLVAVYNNLFVGPRAQQYQGHNQYDPMRGGKGYFWLGNPISDPTEGPEFGCWFRSASGSNHPQVLLPGEDPATDWHDLLTGQPALPDYSVQFRKPDGTQGGAAHTSISTTGELQLGGGPATEGDIRFSNTGTTFVRSGGTSSVDLCVWQHRYCTARTDSPAQETIYIGCKVLEFGEGSYILTNQVDAIRASSFQIFDYRTDTDNGDSSAYFSAWGKGASAGNSNTHGFCCGPNVYFRSAGALDLDGSGDAFNGGKGIFRIDPYQTNVTSGPIVGAFFRVNSTNSHLETLLPGENPSTGWHDLLIGEANTVTNVGGGAALAKAKSGVNTPLRTVVGDGVYTDASVVGDTVKVSFIGSIPSATTPGGSNGEVQINSSGSFAGATRVAAGTDFLSIGASPASVGALRLPSTVVQAVVAGSSTLLAAAAGDGFLFTDSTGSNGMAHGTIETSATIAIRVSGSTQLQFANGTPANWSVTQSYGSSTTASAGWHKFSNNPGTIVAQRNGAGSGDLAMLAANGSDLYLGGNISGTARHANVNVLCTGSVSFYSSNPTFTASDTQFIAYVNNQPIINGAYTSSSNNIVEYSVDGTLTHRDTKDSSSVYVEQNVPVIGVAGCTMGLHGDVTFIDGIPASVVTRSASNLELSKKIWIFPASATAAYTWDITVPNPSGFNDSYEKTIYVGISSAVTIRTSSHAITVTGTGKLVHFAITSSGVFTS